MHDHDEVAVQIGGIADSTNEASKQIAKIASSITSFASAGTDATGGRVESLTEAVMGVTSGLVRIAEAIELLADALGGKLE